MPHIVLVLRIDADLKDQQEQRLHQDAVIVQFLGLPQRQQTQQMRRKCCQNKHCVDHQQHAGYFSDRPGFSSADIWMYSATKKGANMMENILR